MSATTEYLLHLADNAVVLGQRNAEWCGHGPAIEEDIALANVSLDLIGQARLLYQQAAERKYRQACQIVFESQKASASWLQRQLGVGYNTAAKWVERMEADGFVGPANHVGRRDIYRDKDGNPL